MEKLAEKNSLLLPKSFPTFYFPIWGGVRPIKTFHTRMIGTSVSFSEKGHTYFVFIFYHKLSLFIILNF